MKSVLRLLPYSNFSEDMLKTAVWKAEFIVRFYYIALFFLATTRIDDWVDHLAKNLVNPLWPVFWLNLVDYQFGVYIIYSLFIVGTFLAALFPKIRLVRFVAFFALITFAGFNYSFGRIGHSFYAWVLVSFLLIFLPNRERESKTYYRNFLSVFWGAQAIVLLTYTMSGIWKIYYAIVQMRAGQIHAFHPEAMSYQVASRLLETNSAGIFSSFVIDQTWLSWPLYVSAVLIEIIAFFVAFRPSLHRLWAVALISMHIGIYLTMSIDFTKSILLLSIFFFYSPFLVKDNSLKDSLYSLPLVGIFLRKLNNFK